MKWLKEGDPNTAFFSGKVKGQNTYNCILRLQTENGEWIEEEEQKTNYGNSWCAGGELPVKYLGVPLVFSVLTRNQRLVLIKKITHRINSWANTNLSYGGLTKSVLMNIQFYWASIY